MGETYNKEDMMRHLASIAPEGFGLNKDGIYVKSESNVEFGLSFHTEEYFPWSVVYSGPSLRIRFNVIENIISDVSNNIQFSEYLSEPDDFTFSKPFWNNVLSQEERRQITDIEVTNNASFELIKPTLIYLRDKALDWASNHSNFQSCYYFGETLSQDDKCYFYNHPFPLRYMIIKKLLKIPDFEAYSSEVISAELSEGETEWASFFQAVKDYLDAI